ncbi:MAG: Ldh family oxidoreductase [Rhodoblastus sp.]
MSREDWIVVTKAEALAAACAALRAAGCDDSHARAAAQVLVRAEEDGCTSHGLFRLPGFLAALKCGKATGDAAPDVTPLAPGVVRVDGRRGLSPLATEIAREKIAKLARENGIAAAAITNVHHFSALWVDIEPLVAQGLGALICTAYVPFVAPAGAHTALLRHERSCLRISDRRRRLHLRSGVRRHGARRIADCGARRRHRAGGRGRRAGRPADARSRSKSCSARSRRSAATRARRSR